MRYSVEHPKLGWMIEFGYDEAEELQSFEVLCRGRDDFRLNGSHIAYLVKGCNTADDLRKMCLEKELKLDLVTKITFDAFWQEYDHKRDKLKAQRCWDRLPEHKQKAAFIFIAKYKDRCKRDNVPMKYPLTYLNSECWNDK